MPAQAVAQLRQPELLGLRERHDAVHDRRQNGADEDGQDDRGRHGQADEHDREDRTAQQEVQHDQPPCLVIEIARRNPECATQSHPFTPADAIPATKYRWNTTKISRIGRIARTLAAMSGGQLVWYAPMEVRNADWNRVLRLVLQQDSRPEQGVPRALERQNPDGC